MLDVAFTSLAKVLGDDDDPLESISALRLLAIAYAVGWSDKMLTVTPVDFACKQMTPNPKPLDRFPLPSPRVYNRPKGSQWSTKLHEEKKAS